MRCREGSNLRTQRRLSWSSGRETRPVATIVTVVCAIRRSRRRHRPLFSGTQQAAALRSPTLLYHRPRRHCRRLQARKQQQKHQRLPPRHGHESMTGSKITIPVGSHYQQQVCRLSLPRLRWVWWWRGGAPHIYRGATPCFT